MLIRQADDILPSEITPPGIYRERRRFMQGMGALAAGVALGSRRFPLHIVAYRRRKRIRATPCFLHGGKPQAEHRRQETLGAGLDVL